MVVPERAPSAGSGHNKPTHNDLFLQEIAWHSDGVSGLERVALADEHDGRKSASCLRMHHEHPGEAHSPQDFLTVDALSDSSQQSFQARFGGVWIGQRSVSPATLPISAMDDEHDGYGGEGSEDHDGDSPPAADGLQYGKRARSSVYRSRVAGILCLASVLLLVLSMALPRWLIREREVVRVGEDERLSVGATVGLFTVCDDTISGACHRFINNALSSEVRVLLWDVEMEECRELYQATCVCAVLACVLGSIAGFFNFTAPQIDMFKYHVAVFIATIVTVIFTSTSLVCWFTWSGKDLRRPRLERIIAWDHGIGGGFDFGVSFYLMFASTILMVIAGKVVLYEMFITARRDKDGVSRATPDGEQFPSESLTASSPAPAVDDDDDTVFMNPLASSGGGGEHAPVTATSTTTTTTTAPAPAATAHRRDMPASIVTSRSPPPAYREIDILTSTTLCATGSGQSVESSDFSLMGRGSPRLVARVPSAGESSYASSLWTTSKSECTTPCHLLRHAVARSSAMAASPRGNRGSCRDAAGGGGDGGGGAEMARKGSRRFLNRRRWSTVLGGGGGGGGGGGQQRSRSSSDLDVLSNQSARCHLDDDVTTYTVVPNSSQKHRRRRSHSQHDASSACSAAYGDDADNDGGSPRGGGHGNGAYGDRSRGAGCSAYGRTSYASAGVGNAELPSPLNLDIGDLDFDLSLCMRNAALASAGNFHRSPPPTTFDPYKYCDSSGMATPLGEQHDVAVGLSASQRTGNVFDKLDLQPGSPVRNDIAVLHHGLYEYETDL